MPPDGSAIGARAPGGARSLAVDRVAHPRGQSGERRTTVRFRMDRDNAVDSAPAARSPAISGYPTTTRRRAVRKSRVDMLIHGAELVAAEALAAVSSAERSSPRRTHA